MPVSLLSQPKPLLSFSPLKMLSLFATSRCVCPSVWPSICSLAALYYFSIQYPNYVMDRWRDGWTDTDVRNNAVNPSVCSEDVRYPSTREGATEAIGLVLVNLIARLIIGGMRTMSRWQKSTKNVNNFDAQKRKKEAKNKVLVRNRQKTTFPLPLETFGKKAPLRRSCAKKCPQRRNEWI